MQGGRAFAQIMQKKSSRRCDPGRLELLYLLIAGALRKQTGSNRSNAGYTRSGICQQKQRIIAKIDLARLHFQVPGQTLYRASQLGLGPSPGIESAESASPQLDQRQVSRRQIYGSAELSDTQNAILETQGVGEEVLPGYSELPI